MMLHIQTLHYAIICFSHQSFLPAHFQAVGLSPWFRILSTAGGRRFLWDLFFEGRGDRAAPDWESTTNTITPGLKVPDFTSVSHVLPLKTQ